MFTVTGKKATFTNKGYMFLPGSNSETHGSLVKLKEDCFEHKVYPICKNCLYRYVPIKNYKKCFKCTFSK
jgi:hypothetical protein